VRALKKNNVITPSKKNVKSVSLLKKKADAVFSKWIRVRDKICFTCGAKDNLQCGHFIPRSYNSLRYSEINCHAQCIGCNLFKYGNMAEYAERMEKLYGQGIIQKLNRQKRKMKQWKPAELEKIIKKYALNARHQANNLLPKL